jgi:hypothetical protein
MILKALGKTAIKWLLIAVAFIVLLSAINYGLSFVPFTPQFNAKRTAASAARLEGQVSTLEREATGNAEIATATDTYHTREVIYRDIASQAETEARTAPDADTPLSAERADRLRSHDQRMCDSAPAICAPTDSAGGDEAAVPASGSAG